MEGEGYREKGGGGDAREGKERAGGIGGAYARGG